MVNSQSAKTVRIEPDSVRLNPDSAGSYSGASQAHQLVSSIEVDANLLESSPETPLDALLRSRAGDKLSAALDASTSCDAAACFTNTTMDLGLDASGGSRQQQRLAREPGVDRASPLRRPAGRWTSHWPRARASADSTAREKATPRSTWRQRWRRRRGFFAKKTPGGSLRSQRPGLRSLRLRLSAQAFAFGRRWPRALSGALDWPRVSLPGDCQARQNYPRCRGP